MYEHRLFIVNREELYPREEGKSGFVFANVIAEYNCSRMPTKFFDLFADAKEIDFGLFAENSDEETMTDRYGAHCTMLKPSAVIDYLENLMANEDSEWHDYRRLAPLLGLLKGFNPEQWEEFRIDGNDSLWVVHYGY